MFVPFEYITEDSVLAKLPAEFQTAPVVEGVRRLQEEMRSDAQLKPVQHQANFQSPWLCCDFVKMQTQVHPATIVCPVRRTTALSSQHYFAALVTLFQCRPASCRTSPPQPAALLACKWRTVNRRDDSGMNLFCFQMFLAKHTKPSGAALLNPQESL